MSSSNELRRSRGASGAEVEMSQESAASQANKSSLPQKSRDLAASEALPAFTTTTSSVMDESVDNSTDGANIRVLYLDGDVTCAAWRTVPNVDALKEMVREHNQNFFASPSQPDTADRFSNILVPSSVGTATVISASRPLGAPLITEKTQSVPAFPGIQLSPSPDGGARPSWVSIKGATEEELVDILESLPVHVLTRRRIISVLGTGVDAMGLGETESSENDESFSDADDTECSNAGGETDDHAIPSAAVRDNFLEYFPAHGYAVLCLQAAAVSRGESTRRGTVQRNGMSPRGVPLPCAPVVALAFESTLFTFSVDSFGGEGDVRLIMSNYPWPSGFASKTAEPGTPQVPLLGSLSGSRVSTTGLGKKADPIKPVQCDAPSHAVAHHQNGSVSHDGSTPAKDELNTGSGGAARGAFASENEVPEKLVYNMDTSAVDRSFPSAGQHTRESQRPVMQFDSPNDPSSPSHRAATAISVICSSLVTAVVAYLQQSTRAVLMEANQLDELVLQIMPSRVDQDDMLLRTKNLRHLTAFLHMDALQKERVLKELLLPAMRWTPFSQSTQAVERYQRTRSSLRSTILKLRKGRDIINMASMTLVCGVSSRLLSHCNFMDYLNHMQTKIAVIVMPVAVIPGLFAMNVYVPFLEGENQIPFFCILGISMGLMLIGVLPTVYKLFMYKPPGALATVE